MMELTKEELMAYRNILAEIDLLNEQMANVEPEFTKDLVTGSDTEFPFTKHSIKISGYDTQNYERRLLRLRNKINKKYIELVEEKDKIMNFIYSIDDSRIRQILIYRYINGLSWKDIGERMKYGTSTIRLIHGNFMKRLAPISTSKML